MTAVSDWLKGTEKHPHHFFSSGCAPLGRRCLLLLLLLPLLSARRLRAAQSQICPQTQLKETKQNGSSRSRCYFKVSTSTSIRPSGPLEETNPASAPGEKKMLTPAKRAEGAPPSGRVANEPRRFLRYTLVAFFFRLALRQENTHFLLKLCPFSPNC